MNITPDLSAITDQTGRFTAFRAALDLRMRRHLVAPSEAPAHLMAASGAAILSQGKRMRPYLVALAAEGAGNSEAILDAGCALEMVHSASLILDDLPCMDDAQLRRNQPATHMEYGEATAMLAAVGLLSQAFGILAALPASDAQRVALVATMNRAVGWAGLVGGQEYDVNGFAPEDQTDGSALGRIARVNRMKTGILLVAAVEMGAILGGQSTERRLSLARFAEDMGQAFQIADDLGDQLGTADTMGKDVGKDAGKTTFVAELGTDMALRRCLELLRSAQAALDTAGIDAEPFEWLIDQIFDRDRLAAQADCHAEAS
ncbi:polyprenyl synthetase family protein [Falsirhodobacter sp. alg1]|uniref:polyprenyl synthetase family protein n=1 Tax=Falsirhodobacter sp. alg1 TaxID=1472418 RepID=UPI000694CBB3|nr:polyprenyl synthetase family protein [Falsirhodobacter sp. alg1]